MVTTLSACGAAIVLAMGIAITSVSASESPQPQLKTAGKGNAVRVPLTASFNQEPRLKRANPNQFSRLTRSILNHQRERSIHKVVCNLHAMSPTSGVGRDCRVLSQWYRFVASLRGLSPQRQIEEVQRHVNTVPYVPDDKNYGEVDRWSTPREFFRDGGDCEDFAIAKYLALRELGHAAADLRIVVGRSKTSTELHVLLLVRAVQEILVLDDIGYTTTSVEAYRSFDVIAVLNENTLWAVKDAIKEMATMKVPQFSLPERSPCG